MPCCGSVSCAGPPLLELKMVAVRTRMTAKRHSPTLCAASLTTRQVPWSRLLLVLALKHVRGSHCMTIVDCCRTMPQMGLVLCDNEGKPLSDLSKLRLWATITMVRQSLRCTPVCTCCARMCLVHVGRLRFGVCTRKCSLSSVRALASLACAAANVVAAAGCACGFAPHHAPGTCP